jgi:sec-independent protein translocase protein TatA
MGELVVLLIIIVVVFGAGKLPGVGEALGKSVKNFKRAVSASDEIEVGPTAKSLEDRPANPQLDKPAAVDKKTQA